MEQMSTLSLIGALLTVAAVLVAPTVWYYRHNTNRLESEQQRVITKLETTNKEAFQELSGSLKEFRHHFDTRISEVYVAVDSKNRELKDFVSKELDFIRSHIQQLEARHSDTRERVHENEKALLRLQADIKGDYITREELNSFIRDRLSSH